MRQPDPGEAAHRDDGETERMRRLGPPGWDEFSAARERFRRTVAVAGLERALRAPAHDPRPPEWERRAP
jgi:hypothetical protein